MESCSCTRSIFSPQVKDFSIIITARKQIQKTKLLFLGDHDPLFSSTLTHIEINAKLMAVSGEVAYMVNEARVSHRPKTTTPNKPTATIMLSANPPAILVGAWPVYGEGIEEVGDVDVVEVLDVVVLG